MAADFIVVTRTNRPQLGTQLIQLANRLLELRQLSKALNASGQHMFANSDYTVFEAQFGLVAGTGANTLSLLGLVDTIFNTNTDVTGANRFSQMDEFVARLAGQ